MHLLSERKPIDSVATTIERDLYSIIDGANWMNEMLFQYDWMNIKFDTHEEPWAENS